MVPVVTAQVGCTVTLAVGAVGAPAEAVTVKGVADEIQVLSEVLLTVTFIAPAETPVNDTPA